MHKFQQPIGKETFSILRRGGLSELHSDFKFNDRGSNVQLQTILALDKAGAPVEFKIKGKTSRSSRIDAEVQVIDDAVAIRMNEDVKKQRIKGPYFTISGYAPISVQMQLLKYWKLKDEPDSLQVYPTGKVAIKRQGVDTVALDNKKQILERYIIDGLIWGKEVLWTEQSGNLVAVFTNDAEGDKFEAIQENYVKLLPSLIRKAARYSMLEMAANTPAASSRIVALRGGDIIDVVAGKKIPNTTILIKNGIIWKYGAATNIRIPKGAQVIDIAGKTVLPGLWDMHAHFQQVEWGPAYLAAGITTVRDCGNEFDFITTVQQAIDQNRGIGPNILKAGIIDGDGPMALGIIRATTKEEARDAVRKYKENGFEQIKVYSSLKPEVLQAVSEEAHRLGLSVTGHIPEGISLEVALESGLDQINHFHFLLPAMLADPKQAKVNINSPAARETLKLLKEKGVVVDPTLAIFEWITRPLDQPLDAFEPGINHVTEDFKAIYRNTGLPAEQAMESKSLLENGKEVVLAMHRMGIPIVAGTDMLVPGYSLYRELELYNEAGLSPMEAIRTATIVPATVMKMDKETGSINKGKRADLIILDGDPLEAMRNIRKVSIVIKRGIIYDPSKLRKLIGFTDHENGD